MNKSRWFWAISLLFVLLAAFLAYPSTRNSWLMDRAQKSFADGDDRKATLQAMRLVQIAPGFAPATRLLADIAEKNLSKDSLRWRMQSVKIDPSAENQIALARTALYFKEWEWADQALRAVEPAARQNVAYLQTAGTMALAMNQYESAAHFFGKALELDPDNKNLRLNLSITRLAVPDPKLQAQARVDLQQLKTHPDLTIPVLHALIQDALSTKTSPESLVKELLAQKCGFPEYFTALSALGQAGSPEVEHLLPLVQENSADKPGEVYVISNWLVRQNRASDAKKWLETLKPEIRSEPPVPMAYAECLVSLRDWKLLQERLNTEKWADAEILRHAFLWRAERELSPGSRPETGQSNWMEALRGSTVRPGELYMAATLFWSWGWKSEAEALWVTLAKQTQNPDIALRTLDQIYRAQKDTSKLWWISQRAVQTNPRDKVSQNNYAMLSLLLNLDQGKAHSLAESLYRGQPTNSAFLSTYAFSLYRKGRGKEALQLFSTLNPRILQQPEYAFYYAVFLKDQGRDEESARYAKLAEKAPLLPEEKSLLP